ncbi:hypothetical protein ACFL23_03355 [Patescibacteria group bacterium]
MNYNQQQQRLARMNEAFEKCLGCSKEATIKFFGVNSFADLIGKKFNFFVDDDIIFNTIGFLNKDGMKEALSGQVTNVIFCFIPPKIELPIGESPTETIKKASTICEFKGLTCRLYMETTLGDLVPSYGDIGWQLDTFNLKEDVVVFRGDVLFI